MLFKYIDGVKIDGEYVDFFNWSCLLFVFFISLERERAMFRFQPMRRKGEKRERDSSSAQGGNKACFSC